MGPDADVLIKHRDHLLISISPAKPFDSFQIMYNRYSTWWVMEMTIRNCIFNSTAAALASVPWVEDEPHIASTAEWFRTSFTKPLTSFAGLPSYHPGEMFQPSDADWGRQLGNQLLCQNYPIGYVIYGVPTYHPSNLPIRKCLKKNLSALVAILEFVPSDRQYETQYPMK